MNEDEQLSPLGAEMLAGLSAFCDALESGEPIDKRYTLRTISFDLQPTAYGADDVRRVRRILKASQALLAKFLGVSVKAVRAREQETRRVPPIACRFMDEIVANPSLWTRRIQQSVSDRQSPVGP